jgi:hypothetical protein
MEIKEGWIGTMSAEIGTGDKVGEIVCTGVNAGTCDHPVPGNGAPGT